MILLDTDVAVDILRNHSAAVAWLQGLGSTPLATFNVKHYGVVAGLKTIQLY